MNEYVNSIIYDENIENEEKSKLLSIYFQKNKENIPKNNFVQENIIHQEEIVIPSNNIIDYINENNEKLNTNIDINSNYDNNSKNIGTLDFILLENNCVEQISLYKKDSNTSLLNKDFLNSENTSLNQPQRKFKMIPSNLQEFLNKKKTEKFDINEYNRSRNNSSKNIFNLFTKSPDLNNFYLNTDTNVINIDKLINNPDLSTKYIENNKNKNNFGSSLNLIEKNKESSDNQNIYNFVEDKNNLTSNLNKSNNSVIRNENNKNVLSDSEIYNYINIPYSDLLGNYFIK